MRAALAVLAALALFTAAPAAAQRGAALAAPEGYGDDADAHDTSVELDVIHRDRPVRVYARRAGGAMEGPLCTTPCTLHLMEGEYELDLAPLRGRPYEAEGGPFRVNPTRSVIVADYNDRSAVRIAGWVLFTIGVTGIAAALVAPTIQLAGGGIDFGGVFSMMIGIPLGGAIALISLPMVALRDSVTAVQHRPRETR